MHTLADPQHVRRFTLPDRVRSLATILLEEFGVSFRFYGANDGVSLLAADQPSRGAELSREELAWIVQFGAVEQSGVTPALGGNYRLAISLHDEGRPALVALGLKASVARPHPDAIREETLRLEKWLRAVSDRLRFAGQTGCRHRAEPAKLAMRTDGWEVIVQLEQLMRVQKTHKEPVKNRRRVLCSAADLVPVQSLVFVPTKADDLMVCAGEALLSPWDCGQLVSVLSKSPDCEGSGYLIRNDVATSSWAARFSQIANLLAIPILDGVPVGWLIAINKKTIHSCGPEGALDEDPTRGPNPQIAPFRRTDAAMLAPFASLLGYHARAFQSYSHLRELLIGLTRSLTTAIDAKDSYTYGHSERVARIAVELGRELGLQDDELSDTYLAGLLHDIGKIGIRDDVLRKRGPLDDQEFEHVKEHVKIGYRILSGLNAISHLLPGVLYHHERYDGTGYPEGLKGNTIPFLARILAVADSYDAMSTSRPYRTALPYEEIERVLVNGSNTQWDKEVVDAFVRCKERVRTIRQRGVGESLCGALDDALRKGNRREELSSMVSILNH
jgi:HD-GYP domain-containing protein (c-di-GMP phosphodiesterase class II)